MAGLERLPPSLSLLARRSVPGVRLSLGEQSVDAQLVLRERRRGKNEQHYHTQQLLLAREGQESVVLRQVNFLLMHHI